MSDKKIKWLLFLMFLSLMAVLSACGNQENKNKTKVVLTAGFKRGEVFRIEKSSCMLPEIMVYLTNTQNQYEAVFGKEIWEKKIDGMTLEDNIKDTVLARMAQIKTMNLLAEKYQVSLNEKEMETVKKAASQYFSSLNEVEAEMMAVTEDTIISLYREYATANKVYSYIIKDINPEISDDEARTIQVQQILIKTYTLNLEGVKIPYAEAEKQKALEQANEILQKAQNGEDFEGLMDQYSEDSKKTYSFGKGEMDKAFEDAAFQLGNGEISGVVETEYGYHIIKCLSTFDKEETDANKIKIMEQRKKEVFNKEYEDFVNSLNKNMNYNLWEEVSFVHDDQINTRDFFQIFDSYFPNL